MEKNNILLHKSQFNGEKWVFKEFYPPMEKEFPQFLSLDSSGDIIWKSVNFNHQSNENEIYLLKETLKDLFTVVSEQQNRLDEMTDSINQIINFLK